VFVAFGSGSVAQYPEAKEVGGLSGPPLMDLATDVLADMYRRTGQGKVCIDTGH
jgi:dihydroorotate dehydrogenase